MKKLLSLFLLFSLPVHAHHSDAGIDMDSVLAFDGVVKEYNWRNPHVYLIVERVDDSGNSVEWELQMGATSVQLRRGWSPDSVAPGDKVTVRINAARNGRPYGIIETLDKEGGLSLSSNFNPPESTAIATSIAGRWIADRSSYPDYPGGYDGLFRAILSPNDKALEAQAAFDPLSSENPDASCIGRPTPGGFVSSNLYLMEIEIDEENQLIHIRSERDAEERIVYMDGRGHPDAGASFDRGHSIGKWEGDILVIDTANFVFHRSPYQFGVPSSTRKQVIERYRLSDDGTQLEAEFTLQDPEYLTTPATHSRLLNYSPHMQMYMNKCDPESASNFLD